MFTSIFINVFIVFNTAITAIFLLINFISVKGKKNRIYLAQSYANSWGSRIINTTGASVEVLGKENIDPNKCYLIISNHSSNFDVMLILGFLGIRCCFISKRLYFKIIFMGWIMKQMNCVPINRKNKREALKSLKLAAEVCKDKYNLCIFPEGTRSENAGSINFKPGFLHIVKLVGEVEILPVTISGTEKIQKKNSMKITPTKLRLTIDKSIKLSAKDVDSTEAKQKIIKKLEDIIRSNYIANL